VYVIYRHRTVLQYIDALRVQTDRVVQVGVEADQVEISLQVSDAGPAFGLHLSHNGTM